MRFVHALLAFLLVAHAGLAAAQDSKAGAIRVAHPWARPTVAGQMAGGGYLKLENTGQADRLVGVSTPVAERAELHVMNMDGDTMRMRQVDGIDLPAGQSVELKPGGFHVMLMGLKQPLGAGSTFPLKLKFEKAGEVTVDVKVETPTAGAAPEHKH